MGLFLANYQYASATSYTWNGTGNSNTSNGWGTSTSWTANGLPGSGDTITFNGTGASNAAVTLGGSRSVGTITVSAGETGATTFTSGGTSGYVLTMGSGGFTQAASTGAVTLGSTSAVDNFAINLGASQTWSNASGNSLLAYANINGTAAAASTQTLTTSGSGNMTLAGNVGDGSGGGQLAINASGSGNVILSGANTYSGKTTASSGTLQFNGASSMSGNSALSLASGSTIALRSDTPATFAAASLTSTASTGTLNFDVNNLTSGNSNTLTLSGTLSLASNSINTINVTGGNGYTLALGGITLPSSSGNATNHVVTINATSAGVNSGVISFGSFGATANFDGTQAITVPNLAEGSNGSNVVVIGNGSDAPIVTIQGATTGFNGRNSGTLGFTLNSGTFNMNHASVLANGGSGSGAATFTINGGTLDNTSGAAITTIASSAMQLSGNFAFSTAAGTNKNNLTLEPSSLLDTQAALTVTLNGGGTLTIGTSALQNSTAGNQTLTVNNGSGTGAGTILFLDGYVLSTTASTARTDTINGSATVNMYGAIKDVSSGTAASSLTYAGTGTLILSGSNTYSGTTTISSGVVQLGTGVTTGSLASTGTIVDNGGLVFNRSNSVVQGTDFSSAAITGTGSISQAGSGTTTLNAANTYSGGTAISAGEIIANVGGTSSSSSSALGTGTGAVTISGGVLLIGATTSSSSNINFYNPITMSGGVLQANDGFTHVKGAVTLNGGTLAGSYNDTNGTSRKGLWLDGSISGSGNVTVAYLGNGTNSYNGTMVRITSSGNSYSGTMTVNPSANNGGSYLLLDTSNALPNAVIDLAGSNTGSLTQFGASTLVFGNTTTSAAINGLAGSGSLTLQNVATTPAAVALTVGGGAAPVSTTYSGSMSGPGSLTKAGSGTLTLSGSNSYGGGTTVSGGMLVLTNSNGSGTGTAALNVNAGATLAGTGSSAGTTFDIAGTNSSNRANVLVGHVSASDLNTTSTLKLTATTGTLSNANLTFNLNTAVVGQGNVLNVGTTTMTFSNTLLTLNLENSALIPQNSAYTLIQGNGVTTGLPTSPSQGIVTTGGQFGGLQVFINNQGLAQIVGGTFNGGGPLSLQFGTNQDNTYYGQAGSYLFISQSGGIDSIEVEVVPEPGTWALVLGGLGMLIFWQRRRRS